MKNKKYWEAKSGRWKKTFILGISLLFPTLPVVGIPIAGFFTVPLFFVLLFKLWRTKIATKLEINPEAELLRLVYHNGTKEEYSLNNICFSVSEDSREYSSIAFHLIAEGSRGQLFKVRKLHELVAVDYILPGIKHAFSWRKEQLAEIYAVLTRLEVVEMNPEDRGLSLWEKFIFI